MFVRLDQTVLEMGSDCSVGTDRPKADVPAPHPAHAPATIRMGRDHSPNLPVKSWPQDEAKRLVKSSLDKVRTWCRRPAHTWVLGRV